MDSDIIRFKPFLYKYTNYMGTKSKITFTCPMCGGHNCEKIGDLDKNCFWSGHYRCTDCGATKGKDGNAINYYSDAFVRTEEKVPTQLELF